MANAECIYCAGSFDPSKGEGDHVIPRGFGDFDGALIFRGVCPKCNNRLGQLEEEILRTAPEASLRGLVGAMQNRRGMPVGPRGASGLPPPKFVIRHADHTELAHLDSIAPQRVIPVDQLVVVLKSGREFHIRLFPEMTAHAVRREFDKLVYCVSQ